MTTDYKAMGNSIDAKVVLRMMLKPDRNTFEFEWLHTPVIRKMYFAGLVASVTGNDKAYFITDLGKLLVRGIDNIDNFLDMLRLYEYYSKDSIPLTTMLEMIGGSYTTAGKQIVQAEKAGILLAFVDELGVVSYKLTPFGKVVFSVFTDKEVQDDNS